VGSQCADMAVRAPVRFGQHALDTTTLTGRQDAAITGTLEACHHPVEAAILAAPAKRDGFQPRVPKADTVSNCTRDGMTVSFGFASAG
jgi:hypothetical protein